MKKLIFLLLLLLIATPVFAQQQEARMSLGVIGGSVPAGVAAGSWTWIAQDHAFVGATGTSLDMESTFNVAVGDVLVAVVGWINGTSTVAIAEKTSGHEAFTVLATDTYLSQNYMCMGYRIITDANATLQLTVTYGTSREYRIASIMQFRPTAGTVSVDAESPGTANGSGATGTSATINNSADGTPLVVAGCYTYGEDSAHAGFLISNAAATGSYTNHNIISEWYKATASATLHAECTFTSTYWVVQLLAFNITP